VSKESRYLFDVTRRLGWEGPLPQSLDELSPIIKYGVIKAHERRGTPEEIEVLSIDLVPGMDVLQVTTRSRKK
jgi:hypothetical protein